MCFYTNRLEDAHSWSECQYYCVRVAVYFYLF